MIRKISVSVSILALLLAAPQIAGASDSPANLKKQLQELTKKVGLLEAQQAAIEEATEEQTTALEESQQKLEAKNQQLKADSQSTVKVGSLPGSYLIPGTGTSLKVHGFVKLDVIHENHIPGGDNATDSDNNFTNIPLKGTSTYRKGDQTQMFLKETRLAIDTNTPTDFGSVFSRIETDFYGSSAVLRLRKAYVKVATSQHEVLAGQEWTLFADENATADAETLDFGGIAGLAGDREAQIRYTLNPRGPVTFAASLENSDTTYYAYDTTTGSTANGNNISTDKNLKTLGTSAIKSDRLPDLILAANIGESGTGASLRVITTEQRIAGLQGVGVSNTSTFMRDAKRGYGIAHAGFYTLPNKDKVTYDITYGTGLGGWMTGGSGAVLDVANSKLFLQRTLGLAASYRHAWNDMWRSTLGLGYLRVYNRKFMKTIQTNKWVRDLHVNLIAEPVKNLHTGIEYGLGQRRVEALSTDTGASATKKTGTDHRVQFSVKYVF